MSERTGNRQSLFSRIMNPKYIMVYATVIIFLIIYAYGALRYGSIASPRCAHSSASSPTTPTTASPPWA